MIIKELESIIEKQKREGEFIYPLYKKYCFSNIPSMILEFFGIKTKRPSLPSEFFKDHVEIEDANKVVLLLIDGFGYDQWPTYSKNHEFFNTFSQKGVVMPITTIFPSTTAATLTTINSGLTPQEHALPEWWTYFKEIDMIINTLPFTPLYKRGQDSLLDMGVSPKILFKGNSIHQALRKEDVKSFTLINQSYAFSSYSKLVHKGSATIPFINSLDLAVRLRKILEKETGPAYFYAYLDDLDSVGHKYGPHTEEYHAELSIISYILKKELLEKMDKKASDKTIFLMTADHGQINTSPKDTIYLNKYRKLVNAFRFSENGRPILPSGSPRDIFLHIQTEKLEEVQSFLSDELKEEAKIMRTIDAIKMGLFGIGRPRKEFYDRVGDLLILPRKNNTIWYEHIKGEKFNLLGHHGGLSKNEMLVPFAIAKLSDLV